MELALHKLEIKKAAKDDWNSILKLLEEADLTTWFTGSESYKNFYIVKDPNDKTMICCFAIELENEIGILKSFAIKKEFRGKGTGKYIVDKYILELAKSLKIKKLFAASMEAPIFWRKTVFNEIKIQDVDNKFFLNYLNNFKDKIENYFEQTALFCLELI